MRVQAVMTMATLALSAALALPAAAQEPTPALAGSWVIDTERSQSPQDAMAALRGGAGGGMAMRRADGGGGGGGGGGVVMRREGQGPGVIGVMQGGQRVSIAIEAEKVTLIVDDGAPLALPLTGERTIVNRWDQQLDARARLADGTLTVETTLPNDVVVTETFSVDDAGDLTVVLRLPLAMRGAGDAPTITLTRMYTRSQ